MPDTVDLSKLICPAFYPVHESIWDNDHSEYWLVGGRGSTKSSFVAIQIILGIITDPNANAVCLRKVKDTVRNSIMPTLLWAIDVLGATDQFSHIKSPTEITYIPTGQKIIMTGLDDPTKLKSIKTIKGYLKYLWFEEANQFHGMEEIRNVEQSIIRGGKNFVEFITYNPPNDPAAWVNKEIKNEYPDRYVHTSSYLEVPPEWLGEDFFKKANRLREFDPIKYAHEYLGQVVGRAEQIIFFGKWEIKEFDTHPIDEIYEKRFFFGADWGFANDPTFITRQYITVQNDKRYLWCDYEASGVGIEFEQLSQLFDSIPDIRNWKIYADSARPETISYMQRQGFRIEAAEKWKGSVEDGIEYLKSFDKIYVHPRCKQSIEEFTKYSYKVDRITQEILPVIVDDHNHGHDSRRYALSDYIKKQPQGFFDMI